MNSQQISFLIMLRHNNVNHSLEYFRLVYGRGVSFKRLVLTGLDLKGFHRQRAQLTVNTMFKVSGPFWQLVVVASCFIDALNWLF